VYACLVVGLFQQATTIEIDSAMPNINCPCVLPSATEEELATIPGAAPGTALRVRVEPSLHGYVRLEQLAYSPDLGWYTQKSFCVPGEIIRQLIPHLRKADCLIPRPPREEEDATLLFPLPATGPRPALAQKREA
jgi:hypothetical protein